MPLPPQSGNEGRVMSPRGFCGVGVDHPKAAVNVGTLWRTAVIFGASFLFTVGKRFPKQASDTIKTWKHVPHFHFETLDDLVAHLPYECQLVGVEIDDRAKWLSDFRHPERACYILGAEDAGLSEDARARCNHLVRLPGDFCLNVAVAGSIVLYDRVAA